MTEEVPEAKRAARVIAVVPDQDLDAPDAPVRITKTTVTNCDVRSRSLFAFCLTLCPSSSVKLPIVYCMLYVWVCTCKFTVLCLCEVFGV